MRATAIEATEAPQKTLQEKKLKMPHTHNFILLPYLLRKRKWREMKENA